MVKRESKKVLSSEDEEECEESQEPDSDSEENEEIESTGAGYKNEEKEYSPSNSFRKIFIAHKSIEEIGYECTKAVSLIHPRTKSEALFLVDFNEKETRTDTCFIYEILTMVQPLRSWFVDDSVISNGNLNTLTPLDPLFMILPVLSKTTKAMPFPDHLVEAFPPTLARIFCSRISPKQLENIAVKKVCGDIEAYAYSEEATLAWLSKKAKKASQFLSKKTISASEVSVSLNFTKSSSTNGDNEIEREYLQYACDIVGDYIDDALKRKLLTKFGLPTEPERSKRKNDEDTGKDGIDGNKKKLKVTDNVQPLEDYGTNSTDSPTASKTVGRGKAKEKELLKAAQGTRSLLSFFAPKGKKA